MPKTGVRHLEVGPDQAGRRLDNFLVGALKNAPKSFIYRIIRSGEVRVNGARSRPATKLAAADLVRVPPMRSEDEQTRTVSPAKLALVNDAILFENDTTLVINKPAGLAVHGGSGLHFGVVDIVRQLRPATPALELVHRLDRDTSGCLIFAKDYSSLRMQQAQLNKPDARKTYLSVLCGVLGQRRIQAEFPLLTHRNGGEKRTSVDSGGKAASTEFVLIEQFDGLSLVEARITTGRTHQIRVHAAAIGHPVAGDKKYGDLVMNATLRERGLKRMFLHAASVTIRPGPGARPITVTAPLPAELEQFLIEIRHT